MKKIFFFVIVIVQSSALSYAQEMKMIWHDEFDALNSENWGYEHGYVRNREYQWYQEENAFVEDGKLIIEARYDSTVEHRITSASINTRGHFEFQYGRLEVRAKIPPVRGSWPAIWTLGHATHWPACGEIDVMEYYQIGGVPHILANAAWGGQRRHEAVWDSERIPYSHFTDKDPDWGKKFHTWIMDWNEKEIRLYLDGELLNIIDIDVNDSLSPNTLSPNPKKIAFHTPHYILLNIAIGGTNGGEPLLEAFPLRYEIDYVRVYKFL